MMVGGLINGGAGVATGGLLGAARGLIKKGEEAEINPGTEFNLILNRSVFDECLSLIMILVLIQGLICAHL